MGLYNFKPEKMCPIFTNKYWWGIVYKSKEMKIRYNCLLRTFLGENGNKLQYLLAQLYREY